MCILLLVLLASPQLPPDRAKCLGCHVQVRLVPGESRRHGFPVPLTEERYLASPHASLSCVECHAEGLGVIPHPPGPHPTRSCRTCHPTDPTGCSRTPLEVFETSSLADVHHQKFQLPLSCASCHDPHAPSSPSCPRVHESNPRCTACHGGLGLLKAHLWLPAASLHLRRLGCTACHFLPGEPGSTHFVLPKEASLKSCATCHHREKALAFFGARAQAWERRAVPGWRPRRLLLWCAAGGVPAAVWLLLRGRRPWGGAQPAGLLWATSMAALVVSGAAIALGKGWALEPLSHLHALAGMLFLAASLERVVFRPGWHRTLGPWPLKLVLAGTALTGLVLFAPLLTSSLDEALPVVRTLHRCGALLVALGCGAALLAPRSG